MLTCSTRRRSGEELEAIVKSHSRGELAIEPRLYDLWFDGLVATVQDLDPEFDRSVEMAWRIVMAPGIEFMKGHY